MTGTAVYCHKLALALDGGDANGMLARMTSGEAPISRRKLGGGELAVSRPSTSTGEGSVTLYLGQPMGAGPLPAPASADEAAQAFTQLEGAFVAIHWDAPAQILVVVSDFLGMAPLYWRRGPEGMALFSETKAVHGEPDLAGWGAFIAMGHPIGNRTLLQGVERFPAATVLRYEIPGGRLTMNTYWTGSPAEPSWTTGDFIEALAENVRDYASLVEDPTLFLSGGFDSRLILFLLKREGIPTRARIIAHDDELGDADGRSATKAAEGAGVPVELCYPDPEYFDSDAFLSHVAGVDGESSTLGLFIAKLYPFIPEGGFWDGLIPGVVFPNAHNPGGGFQAYAAQEVTGRWNPRWEAAKRLFGATTVLEMQEAFERDFAGLRKAYPDNPQGVTRFVLENRARRRTGQNPLKAFANRGTPLMPGLRRDIVQQALALPYAAKAGGAFYRDLLKKVHPQALDAPVISGGTPVPRHRLDLAAIGLSWRSGISRSISRHPRVFRKLGWEPLGNQVFVPHVVRAHWEWDTDRWVDREVLRQADPDSSQGFGVWRLYFHWAAWRSLHSPEARGVPFPSVAEKGGAT